MDCIPSKWLFSWLIIIIISTYLFLDMCCLATGPVKPADLDTKKKVKIWWSIKKLIVFFFVWWGIRFIIFHHIFIYWIMTSCKAKTKSQYFNLFWQIIQFLKFIVNLQFEKNRLISVYSRFCRRRLRWREGSGYSSSSAWDRAFSLFHFYFISIFILKDTQIYVCRYLTS